MSSTSDPERLQRVALALAEAITARSADARVKLPVIQRADAAGLIGVMHDQLDDAIARRDEEIGDRMACSAGCHACCHLAVGATEGEAIAIADHLQQPEHAQIRARFERAYPAWRARLGDLVERSADVRTDEEVYAWTLAVRGKQALCALNHDGLCSVYAVRPSVCRKAHALDTSARCEVVAPDNQLEYFAHPETEQLYASQDAMRMALHSALRPDQPLELVCEAVHRLLVARAPGRNEPCPCGSGKKFKKCCGA